MTNYESENDQSTSDHPRRDQSPGHEPPPPYYTAPPIPLHRSRNKMLGGVIAGLAERANIDIAIARVLAVLAFVFSAGAVTVAYVAAWILMPGPDSVTAPIARWQHQPPPAT